MASDPLPRIRELQNLAQRFGWRVGVRHHNLGSLDGQAHCLTVAFYGGRGLVDQQVDALGVLHHKMVGLGIAGPYEAQIVPIETIADRPIHDVQSRKVLDGHAVLLVGDARIGSVIERLQATYHDRI